MWLSIESTNALTLQCMTGDLTMVDTLSTNSQKLVTEKQAAKMLSVSPRTLRNWRTRGGGPRFVKISERCIRYRIADLNEWTKERTKHSTSDLGILPFEI